MKFLFKVIFLLCVALAENTWPAGAAHQLNQGIETEDTPQLVQALRAVDTGKKHLHSIVQKGKAFPGQSIEVSREAAYRVLNRHARNIQPNKKKKGYGRVGHGQLLAQWGFFPKDFTLDIYHGMVMGRLLNIWTRRETSWAQAILGGPDVGMSHPRKFMGYVGTWIALLKSDLFHCGFLNGERRDLLGAWNTLQVVSQTYSQSKTIPLFMAGVLLEGIEHGFNPFPDHETREAEMNRLLGVFETVSHTGGTHGHGTGQTHYEYGRVQPKPFHIQGTLHDRLRTHLLAQQQAGAVGDAENDDEDDDMNGDHEGGAPHHMSPPPSPPHLDSDSDDEDEDNDDDPMGGAVAMRDASTRMAHSSSAAASSNRAHEQNLMMDEDTSSVAAATLHLDQASAAASKTESALADSEETAPKASAGAADMEEDEEDDDRESFQPSGHTPERARTDRTARDKEILKLYLAKYSQTQIVAALKPRFPEITKAIVSASYKRQGFSKTAAFTNRITAKGYDAIWSLAEQMQKKGERINYDEIISKTGYSRRQIDKAMQKRRQELGLKKTRRTKEETEALHAQVLKAYVERQASSTPNIVEVVAIEFGLTPGYVSSKIITPAVNKGIIRTNLSRISQEEEELLKAEIAKKDGRTYAQIAADFNAAHYEGAEVVKEWRIKSLQVEVAPVRGKMKKATPAQVKQVRAMIADHPDWTYRQISEEYNRLYGHEHTFSRAAVSEHSRAMKKSGQ